MCLASGWRTPQRVCASLSADLSGCVWLLVAGQYLQHHTAARLLQHLLEHFGVVANLLAVHLLDDVADVEQTLLVDHAPVEDPGNHQLAALYSEGDSLRTQSPNLMIAYYELTPLGIL